MEKTFVGPLRLLMVQSSLIKLVPKPEVNLPKIENIMIMKKVP